MQHEYEMKFDGFGLKDIVEHPGENFIINLFSNMEVIVCIAKL